MAVIENSGLYQYIDENGNIFILYPVTKLENITGASKLVHSTDGKTLSTLDGAKIVLADLEKLDKVANAASRVEYVDDVLKTLGGAEIPMGNAKIATGSYVGTGAYGEGSPCTLSFDFAPKFMAIKQRGVKPGEMGAVSTAPNFFVIASWTEEYTNCAYTAQYAERACGKTSNEGRTIHWYSANTANEQLNELNKTYHYVAIG